MRTDALIEQLAEIHPKGFDLSLDRIAALLEKLGNPHRSIPPAFHVAGTNGKGSTVAFVRSILESAGYRTSVHTSPHLVNWHERYRLGGKLVSDDILADALEQVIAANDGCPITIFEIMSAVMFVLFSEHEADYSIVEVGLGGRFDATNMIENPLVSAISPIALDHQAYLGDTIEEIAFEKAGIIKEGVPVVIGRQLDAARKVIENVAEERKSPCTIARQDFDYHREATGFVYQDDFGLLDLPTPGLIGEHQLDNAALAIATVRASGVPVPDEAFALGMRNVEWPGRFEKLAPGSIHQRFADDVSIIVDGGHNPAAGQAVAAELHHRYGSGSGGVVMICGMLTTKEPLGYFNPFRPIVSRVVTVPVTMSDAGYDPHQLASIADEAGLAASAAGSLDDAIRETGNLIAGAPGSVLLFCGSLYLVGEVLELNGTPPQ